MSSWRPFTRMAKMVIITSRRHAGGVHGGVMAMETTMILKVILFTI
jgi:hypothetical protein